MRDRMDEDGPYAGMTVNERLFSAGLMELWDRAKAAEDRAEMARLLGRVGFDKASALATADLSIRIKRQGLRKQKPC